jgi:hypothetical protein
MTDSPISTDSPSPPDRSEGNRWCPRPLKGGTDTDFRKRADPTDTDPREVTPPLTPAATRMHTPAVSTAATSGTRARPSRSGRRKAVTLTPARIAKICEQVAAGVPQGAASAALGIPKATFQRWLADGRLEGASGPCAELAAGLDRALGRFHASRAVDVVRHAEKDPRSAMFVLERRFRDDWGDPGRGVGTTVNVNLQAAPEWLELRARILGALARHPDALADVLAELGGGQVVEGEAVELAELAA